MKLTKKTIYVGLFAILYLIVAFSSFFHACAFFGLANNSWMSIILAFAFEVGQAAVLFSLLTSSKDRGRVMPWVLMTMFTLVQVIGNVYSSYKYIITNSVDNLRYFKEPIFIWTDLPDAQANVIIVYLVGALLPIAALLLTSMITNYLTDQSEELNEPIELDSPPEREGLSDKQEIENLNVTIDKKDEEIDKLKKELEQLHNVHNDSLHNEHYDSLHNEDKSCKNIESETFDKLDNNEVHEVEQIKDEPHVDNKIPENDINDSEEVEQNANQIEKSNEEKSEDKLEDISNNVTDKTDNKIENKEKEIVHNPNVVNKEKVENVIDETPVKNLINKKSHFINL